MGRAYTKKHDATIREMASNGHTIKQIAKALGRSYNSMIGRMRRIGVKATHQNHVYWSDAEIYTLRAMANKNHNAIDVSERLGRSPRCVRIKAFREGISLKGAITGERNHNAKLTRDDVEMIRVLYSEGLPGELIAEKMDVSAAHISRIVNYRVRLEG